MIGLSNLWEAWTQQLKSLFLDWEWDTGSSSPSSKDWKSPIQLNVCATWFLKPQTTSYSPAPPSKLWNIRLAQFSGCTQAALEAETLQPTAGCLAHKIENLAQPGTQKMFWTWTVVLPITSMAFWKDICLFVGCLTSQQHASVSQGWTCSDNFTCCHTEIEVAGQTFHLTQSQYTDTGPASPSTETIAPGAWLGSHWSANA